MHDINNYAFSNENSIGRGSFSKVFLGKNIINEEDIAIKIIDIPKCNNIVDINKEINILKELQHKNILELKDT